MTSDKQSQKILLVEDDPLLAATLARQITRLQPLATVISAASCEEAREMWKAVSPQLIVLDYRLPDGFGTDVVKEMRRQKQNTPVACMSGESEQISPDVQKKLKIEHVFTKPVSTEQLQTFFEKRKPQTQEPIQKKPKNTKKIGRFRVIRTHAPLTTARCKQLRQRMQTMQTNWIVLEVKHPLHEDDTPKTLATWAAWISANGGRLCILATDPEIYKTLKKQVGKFVDIFASPEKVKADQLRLTGFAERNLLLHAIKAPVAPNKDKTPPDASPKAGFTVAAAVASLLLVTTALSVVGALLYAMRTSIEDIPDLTPFELATRWARESIEEHDAFAAFHYLGEAIERAQNDEQRHNTVHKMIQLLMEEDHDIVGISREHRQKMAAEYIRGLVEHATLTDEMIAAFCQYSFQIAKALRNPEMLELAENLMEQHAPSVETLLYAFDAFAACNKPRKALLALHEINRMETLTPRQKLELQYRRMRVLEKAITDNAWLMAGGSRLAKTPPENRIPHLRKTLKQEAKALTETRISPFDSHGFMALARLAEQESRYNDAITYLKAFRSTHHIADPGDTARMLLRNLRRTASHGEANALRDEFMLDPKTAEAAFEDLVAAFQQAETTEQINALLQTVDLALVNLAGIRTDTGNLLIEAAKAARKLGDAERMERYLQADDRFDHQRRRVAQRYLQFANLAGLRENYQQKIENLQNLIEVSPNRDIERDARFLLFDTLHKNNASIPDLTQTIVGISVRFPNDPKLAPRLRITAEQLEKKHLFESAELYYSQAALLGTMHLHSRLIDPMEAAKSMLGQSRVLMATGRTMEADSILRTVNSQERWAEVWPQAGPLWATIAMQNNQPQEAIRRWRQTSGPPQDPLLPMLFDILVPNMQDLALTQVRVARKPPEHIPSQLVHAATNAAFKKLLAQNAYDRIGELLETIEQDPRWKKELPTHAFRTQTLEHIIASEPLPTARQWVATQNRTGASDAQLEELEQLAQRAQNMVF